MNETIIAHKINQFDTMILENSAAIDLLWVLIATILVFLMQAGFSLLEAGSVRTKNTKSILIKNLSDMLVGTAGWSMTGYAIAFGTSAGGFVGTDGYFLDDLENHASFFFFQCAFATTAATIDSGAVAERMDLSAYILSSFIICLVIYPFPVHWVWNDDGWAAVLGFKDFAGSAVVHMIGGISGIVTAWMIGPRIGRFKNGQPQDIPGHSLVLQSLGCWILLVCWMGFNGGSTLGFTGGNAELSVKVCVNTLFAGLTASLTALLMSKWIFGKYDMSDSFNALLGGLVSITAPCAFVSPLSSILIGVIGGIVYIASAKALLYRLKIDDPLNAFPVHGACGFWGALSVGLFDREGGLLTTGQTRQLGIQILVLLAIIAWTTALCYFSLIFIKKIVGELRVPTDIERAGCDSELSGGAAYYLIENQTEEQMHILEDILGDQKALEIFRRFLVSNCSEELLDFYRAVKRIEVMEKVTPKDVQEIYHRYLKSAAEHEVNLPSWVKQAISLKRNNPTNDIFSEAKEESFKMMRNMVDSHFFTSDYAQEYLELREAQKGKPMLHFLRSIWCCKSESISASASQGVEDSLEKMREAEVTKFSILLLGAGECGKSTFYNQVDMLFSHSISNAKIHQVIYALRVNTVETVQRLITQAEKFGYRFEGENEMVRDTILAMDVNNHGYTQNDAVLISKMWHHPLIRKTYERRGEYWLLESANYYLDHAIRFADGEEPFAPEEEDFLRARIKTVGVTVNNLIQPLLSITPAFSDVKGAELLPLTWKLIDVGGQRAERRKWLPYLDNMDSVLFLVNLGGYQELLYEDEGQLRMIESLELLKTTFKSGTFKNTPIWLVFNKVDIYLEHFSSEGMQLCFPEISPEVASNPDTALSFIQKIFLEAFPPDHMVEAVTISALKKDHVQKLFDRVQQTVLSSHIMDIDQLLAKRANSKPKFNSESAKSHVLKDMHALHHSTTRLSTIPQDMNNERVKPEDLRNIVTQEDGSSIASSRARNKVTPVVKVLSASG